MRQGITVLLVILLQVGHGITRTGDVITGCIHIDHEAGRRNADQHQHDKADAFLAVVGAVREADANRRQDQCDTGPERRLAFAVDLSRSAGVMWIRWRFLVPLQ